MPDDQTEENLAVETNFEDKLKSISKQSGILFIAKITFQFIGFFSSIVLARVLGSALLGNYQLGITTVKILARFTIIGFDKSLVRYIPILNLQDLGKTKRLLHSNALVVLSLSIVLGTLLYFFAPMVALRIFHSEEMIAVLRKFAFYLPFTSILGFCIGVVRGLKRADMEAYISNFLNPSTFILLLLVVILIDGSLNEVISARIAASGISVLVVIIFLRRKYAKIFKSKSKAFDYKGYVAYTIPAFFIGLLYVLMTEVDVLMLGYFLESSQVGIYSVVVNLAGILIFGLQSVGTIFSPNIAELCELKDFTNLEKLLKVLTKWIFYVSLLIYSIIVIFRVEFLSIFGPAFIAGATALIILAFGQLVNAFSGSTGNVLLMSGKQNWELMNSTLIVIFNIILNAILIPKYGINGAAIATSSSIAIVNLIKLIETYMIFKIHPYNFKYFKGLIAILIAAAFGVAAHMILTHLNLSFILIIIIGSIFIALITILLLYLFKFDEEDKLIINRVLQKFHLKINI
jgi:O-antigen/teichoic acid export membrane protein